MELKIKTQTYGSWNLNPSDIHGLFRTGYIIVDSVFVVFGPDLHLHRDLSDPAVEDLKAKRENGTESDNPSRRFPKDGKYSWVMERVEESNVQGVDNGYNYIYEVRYFQGLDDKAWLEEKDKKYLERIEREGKLKELEPAVYYLRVKEQATSSIRDWWAQKLLLPDLGRILEQANPAHDRLVNAAQLKIVVINEAIAEANISGSINFAAIVAECVNRARASSWYTHPDLPANTLPYDFNLSIKDMSKLFSAIRTRHNIKILDLSNINLSEDFTYVRELFKVRNDFIVINLANTNLDDVTLRALLDALYLNHETRGVPLIERLNLAHNKLTAINFIIDFIYKCAHSYYWKQKKANAVTFQAFPLTKVNLTHNLIQKENTGTTLQVYVAKLHELQTCSLSNLTISLSGNIITIHVPDPFQEMQGALQGWCTLGNLFVREQDTAENCASLAYKILRAGDKKAEILPTIKQQGSKSMKASSWIFRAPIYSSELYSVSIIKTPDALVKLLKQAKLKECEKQPIIKNIIYPNETNASVNDSWCLVM